jgi:hypothetical protein
VKELKEWRGNEAITQKKKMQKKKEDDKSEEGAASMNDVATLEGELKLAHPRCQVILGHHGGILA